MKTVSGTITNSRDVSLSKAARVLKAFVNTDNGASQAISAFLHRTSEAFNELVHLHKELNQGRSGRNTKKSSSGLSEASNLHNFVKNPPYQEGEKKKKKKKSVEVKVEVEEEIGERKKRKKVEVEQGTVANLEENHRRKKKKRRREEEI